MINPLSGINSFFNFIKIFSIILLHFHNNRLKFINYFAQIGIWIPISFARTYALSSCKSLFESPLPCSNNDFTYDQQTFLYWAEVHEN